MADNKPEINNDEIDLSKVFLKIGDFFTGLRRKILEIEEIIKKRFLLIVIYAIIGVGIGAVAFYKAKPVYTSSMVISSTFFNNDYCSSLIKTLTDVAEDNTANLAQKLDMDKGQAAEIVNIKFKDFNPKITKIYKDSLNVSFPFRIEVGVYNTAILDTLQVKLIAYLENNPYIIKRKNIKKGNLELMMQKIKNESAQVDSLKRIINQSIIPKGNVNGIVFGAPLDPVKIHHEAINLYENELKTREELILLDNVEIIEGFTKFTKPTSPNLYSNVSVLGLAGFLIGLIIAYKLERKKLTN